MRIRWKVAWIMLAIAVLPLAITAWLEIRTMRNLGNDLAAQSAEVLVDHARESLVQLADDYVRLIGREQQLVESALRRQANEIERLLSAPAPETAFHGIADFQARAAALQLTEGERYFELDAGGAAVPFPVSYRHPVFLMLEPSEANAADARRLTAMQPLMAEIQENLGDLVYWQYLSLDAGLHMSYPGHGQFPDDFDPRQRSWYVGQRQRDELQWSRPVRDVSTQLSTVGATLPIHDASGEFVGVTGMDVLLTKVLQSLALPAHLAAASRVIVATRLQAPATAAPAAIVIAHQDMEDAGGDWREAIELETLASDTPADTARLMDGMLNARDGMLRLPYRGEDAFWVYRSFGAGNFLVFIVPVSAATQPAQQAADLAIRTADSVINDTLVIILVVVVLVIGIALFVARGVTDPVNELSDAVDAVAQGDFSACVDIRTGDELERLGHAFNAMVPRLQEHARFSETLALAREVQENLLPSAAPDIDGVDIAGVSIYCDHTGGDYFDFLDLRELQPGLLGIVIGDVSGHGIPSALLMTSARALVHGFAGQMHSAAQIFSHINTQLVQDLKAGRFMTLFYLALDVDRGCIEWASAGHEPAFHYNRHSHAAQRLAGRDIPLGIVDDWAYSDSDSAPWRAGDVIMLATDGIWEARNPAGESFGRERLARVLQNHAEESARSICDTLLGELSRFRREEVQRDDVTLIVVKHTG